MMPTGHLIPCWPTLGQHSLSITHPHTNTYKYTLHPFRLFEHITIDFNSQMAAIIEMGFHFDFRSRTYLQFVFVIRSDYGSFYSW